MVCVSKTDLVLICVRKHGTFRPKLLQLVQSNPASSIQDATRKAFKSLNTTDPLPALKILTELRGIGPATASLLLSVDEPGEVPFFSDELFRWVMWEEDAKPGGWKRVIKYSVKEYGVLVEGLKGVRERLGVEAVDVERVAWVLQREGFDVGGDGEGVRKAEEVEVEKEERSEEVEKPQGKPKKAKEMKSTKEVSETKAVKKGVKRKVEDAKSPSEGVRRSGRRKTES